MFDIGYCGLGGVSGQIFRDCPDNPTSHDDLYCSCRWMGDSRLCFGGKWQWCYWVVLLGGNIGQFNLRRISKPRAGAVGVVIDR